MRGRWIAGLAGIAVLVLAGLAAVVLSPGWAAQHAVAEAQAKLQRTLTVKGGAHLSFSPLSIRLDQVTLGPPQGQEENVLTASSISIPVSLGGLIGRSLDLSRMSIEKGEIALMLDERGQPNWAPGDGAAGGIDATLIDCTLRYYDARNAQSLSFGGIGGLLQLGGDGEADFKGTAVLNGRLARLDATLRSLARVNGDGSPLDLALETDNVSATFSGRLSTAKVLSLTGPLSLTSPDAAEAARWAGLPLAAAAGAKGPLNIDGALDSAGRAYGIRNAALTIGGFRAAGDVVIDLRKAVPKLQAVLKAPSVRLDPLVPASGAKPGEWGRTKLALGFLRTFDADVRIEAGSFSYNGLDSGAAQAAATLTGGKLDVALAARLDQPGTVSARVTADTTVLPPALTFDFKADQAEAGPLFRALAGQSWITGRGTLAATVSASGQTQEELAATLKGTASLALSGGAIDRLGAASLQEAVKTKIAEGWGSAGEQTAFDSFTAAAKISDGIASLDSLSLAGPGGTITATGDIDVLRRAVDLAVTTVLPVTIAARGPWAAPRIYPDVEGILKDPAAAFAKLRERLAAAGN